MGFQLPRTFRNASAMLPQRFRKKIGKKTFYFLGSDVKPLFATAAVRKRLGNDPVADEDQTKPDQTRPNRPNQTRPNQTKDEDEENTAPGTQKRPDMP